MKVSNKETYEWRKLHRKEVITQIQPFLKRVGRRGSTKSVDNATTGMVVFCSYLKMLPQEVVQSLHSRDVYSTLDGYVDWMVNECKFAPNSLRNHLSVVKKFLSLNNVEVSNDKMRAKVELPRYYAVTRDRAPSPEELMRVVMHTDVRGKALTTMLASSGMRIGELLSLRVKDIDFSKRPTTVYLRAEVTKDRQARYCFISDEATTFLREFLGQRTAHAESYIFPTSTRGKAHKTGNAPMTYWNADEIFSRALRVSSLEEKDDNGRDVIHIHSLRKFFFSQLVPVLGREVVEALMGHKAFLDSSYRRFTEKQMGEFYLKGINAVTVMMKKESVNEKEVKKAFKEQFLLVAGFKQDEIDGIDLEEMSNEELQKAVRQKLVGMMTVNGSRQRVVGAQEVKSFIGQGYEFVASLPDGEAIVRVPF
jgi:integrase